MAKTTHQKRLKDLKRIQFLATRLSSPTSFISRVPFKLFLISVSMLLMWALFTQIVEHDLAPFVSAILLLVLALIIFLLFKKFPTTWDEILTGMLLSYLPVNAEAFEELRQAHVGAENIRYDVIDEWADVERASVLVEIGASSG